MGMSHLKITVLIYFLFTLKHFEIIKPNKMKFNKDL